ncbi:hypothetical protein Sango_1802300 [Sesamum angolense]|uniref:Uncharacterized protein n=1 Tax=Sesamum angolense TaxID=2727404 RepID=A0AAE1WH90_9LAMI|nr:hypothetical protein Sango_1802300 [Sesamum angolense]
MAQTKMIIAFFFLAILLAQKIQSTEGRNLKYKIKNEFQTHRKISVQNSGSFTKESKDLPRDCSIMTTCGNEAGFTPPPPPPPGHADDFRPTTPGHSPGIGHSL